MANPMYKYQLTIEFDNADLDSIATGHHKVTLRRSTTDQDPANVIWLAFDPLQQNIVQWNTSYGLYASTTRLTPGDIIAKNARVDAAAPGQSYVLGPAFTFSAPQPDPNVPAGSYEVTNHYTSSLVFGLTQDVVVNATLRTGNIINGQSALREMVGIFEPLEKITIYLSNPAADGMVAPDLMASLTMPIPTVTTMQTPSTTLEYGGGTTQITVHYDMAQGRFIETGRAPA